MPTYSICDAMTVASDEGNLLICGVDSVLFHDVLHFVLSVDEKDRYVKATHALSRPKMCLRLNTPHVSWAPNSWHCSKILSSSNIRIIISLPLQCLDNGKDAAKTVEN